MLRVGLIGTGWVAGQHLDALAQVDGAQVVAIAGRNRERAAELARQAAAAGPEPRCYDDPGALLRAEELDAALVLLPPHLHGDLERQLAERVPAVLLEKPVANKLDTARRVADHFARAGTLVAAGYMNRYRPSTQRARSLFAAPAPGPVLVQGWWVNQLPGPLWWRHRAEGGGQFVEQCTHIIDLARWIAGEITEVTAAATRGFVTEVPGYDVDDALVVTARFASGAVGTFSTGCFPVGDPRTGRGAEGIGLTLSGRRVQAHLSGWDFDLTWATTEGQTGIAETAENVFLLQDRAFVEAATRGDPSLVLSTYNDAVRTLSVTLAAEEAARTGKTVRLAP